MHIFPLSIPAKIVLVLIAIFLGLIWSMLQWPGWWKKHFRKQSEVVEEKLDEAHQRAIDAKKK